MDKLKITEKTKKECIEYVLNMGFKKLNERTRCDEAIYYSKDRGVYISYDRTGHRCDRNGNKPKGQWKMAKTIEGLNSIKTRMGTFDWQLNLISP